MDDQGKRDIPLHDPTPYMSAALPVAALAARIAYDSTFSTGLVEAAHKQDHDAFRALMAKAGVQDATLHHASIHIDIGPIHIHADWDK